MKKINAILFLVLFAFLAVSPAHAQSVADKIGYGSLENGVYKNDYFGMQVILPTDWHALDAEGRKEVLQTGKKLIAGDDKGREAVLDASMRNSLDLLTAFKYPLGAAVSFNPSFACVAEKVSHLPGIRRGSDYLFHLKKMLQSTKFRYSFAANTYTQEISGVSFDVQDAELSLGNSRITQKYYAAIIKGYALGFVLTSTTKEDQNVLLQILREMVFKKP